MRSSKLPIPARSARLKKERFTGDRRPFSSTYEPRAISENARSRKTGARGLSSTMEFA
ncbi:MAG: hypothetical protein A4E30_00155 [Methanomassiliicoccales archaeon PtaB.Bin215]|nr:MAG: hypothetical protein A4E30_00155 [Methanomassiliicoccales archaeon PtaB.Bin215]